MVTLRPKHAALWPRALSCWGAGLSTWSVLSLMGREPCGVRKSVGTGARVAWQSSQFSCCNFPSCVLTAQAAGWLCPPVPCTHVPDACVRAEQHLKLRPSLPEPGLLICMRGLMTSVPRVLSQSVAQGGASSGTEKEHSGW